jgi:endonuclease/exonuclease/phosphatase family metal-dependent hydrolase
VAETARFFLFNINLFNRGLPRILPELLAEAGGVDVLLFNEVTRGLERDLLLSTGEPWATVDGRSSHFVGILPFRMSIHIREGGPLGGLEPVGSFLVGRSISGLGGRHLLVARARAAGGSLLLALTHLSPEMPFAPGMRFAVRARQLETLTTRLLELRRPDEPILLAGDFNYTKPGGREVEHHWAADLLDRELDLVDVAGERAGAGRAADTWPARGHFDAGLGAQRMDLFYVSRSWLPRVLDLTVHEWSWKRSGSDHMPVSLVLDC